LLPMVVLSRVSGIKCTSNDSALTLPTVSYSIDGDAKTAEQLWEFRSSLNGQPAFAGFVGDADRLANGNVLITDGGLNGGIDGVTSAQIVEVVPFGSDGGDIVWRLTVEGGAGWVVYRSERLAGVFD